MNHSVTIGGLLSTAVCFVGAAIVAFDVLRGFASGMSDNPADNESQSGWTLFVIGAGLIVIGLFGLSA